MTEYLWIKYSSKAKEGKLMKEQKEEKAKGDETVKQGNYLTEWRVSPLDCWRRTL